MSSRETVVINTRADREKVARWAHGVSEGTIVEFRKKTRSHEQNAKLHAMLAEVSEQVDWYGRKLDPEDWKTVFTASLRKARVIPGIDAGTVVPLSLSTSAMTVDEMSNLIELIYAFGAQPEHPVVFKDPKEPLTGEIIDTTDTDGADPIPSGQTSETDEKSPLSSAKEGGGAATVSSPSTIPADALTHFKDFARKASKTVTDESLSDDAKANAIDYAVMNYRDVLPEDQWDRLDSITKAVQAAFTGKRTIDQARGFIAEMLDCDVREIGG